jgi:hypothetical protein
MTKDLKDFIFPIIQRKFPYNGDRWRPIDYQSVGRKSLLLDDAEFCNKCGKLLQKDEKHSDDECCVFKVMEN